MRKSTLGKSSLALTGIALLLPITVGVLVFLASRAGKIATDDVNLALQIASLIIAIYISIFTGYLSWRALVFAAVPKINIEFMGDAKTGSKEFPPKRATSIKLRFSNLGWWYAKPASTKTEFFLAFGPEFLLKQARYGSQLELVENTVRPGKGNSQYFWVKNIYLYYDEPPEEIVVDVTTPKKPGQYHCWVSAFSDQTTYETYHYMIKIEKPERSVRA